ncbi:MAG: dihydroorotate dehydrogenase-like protein [Candidatus Eisenbacteria bacterium]|nr:dihydroorotate dehydrogenase-like protein [Candidatus Eisenbacteria bacterium]
MEGVVECAKAGAGAVVLKSIFEEQILAEAAELEDKSGTSYWHAEAADYIQAYGRENALDYYEDLIRSAKKRTRIPIIASVHCVSPGRWTEFASRFEKAGADALELNVYIFPADPLRQTARANEDAYREILEAVKRHVNVPVSMKIGSNFSSLPEMALKLQTAGANGLVLFNRFYPFDIDVEKMKVAPGPPLSEPSELSNSLRWVSILSGFVQCDIGASTGVHDGAAVVKQLLAGADAVQACSVLYEKGVDHVGTLVKELSDWMEAHDHTSVAAFKGAMSRDMSSNPAAYERVQFMKLTTAR